jgi:hypothetical protein
MFEAEDSHHGLQGVERLQLDSSTDTVERLSRHRTSSMLPVKNSLRKAATTVMQNPSSNTCL